MSQDKPVTMKDIAQAAGVHPSTVSLVMRGSPRISAAQREKITALAAQMGYHPNLLVSALMKARRNRHEPRSALTAAYLSFEALSPILREQTLFSEFEKGAFSEAPRHGLTLEKFKVTPDMNAARISQILRSRGTMGVIISPLPPHQTSLDLDWQHFCAIAIGPTLRHPRLHQVMSDHYANMNRLLAAGKEWGYSRPALCLDNSSDARIGGQWEAAFLRWNKLEKINRPLLYKYEAFTPGKLAAWLHKQRPDLIICASPQDILTELKNAGLRMPQDIGLASVSAATPTGSLSGIVEDSHEAGAQAVSQLLRMIYNNEHGLPAKPMKILLPACGIHRGKSTR